MAATSGSVDAVTLVVETEAVERRVDRDGAEFYLAHLPEGTIVDGRDLSGALVCSANARESAEKAGLTAMELPAGAPKVVKVPSGKENGLRYERFAVDPSTLCETATAAISRRREVAMAEQALMLLKAGDRDEARGILADILASDGAGGPMPPSQKTVSAYVQDSTMTRGSQMRAYEAVGILTAYLPLCSFNVHSPTEVVPERFAFVVFDEGHCVSGTYFNQLLERVRARVPQHAGAMDEHSIGYVARQLREPFARVRDRYVAQVNGIGVDFTDKVRAIPGAALVRHRGTDATRDVLDLGMATISIDRLALINGGMYLTQADSAVDWAQSMMRSSLEFACDRMAMANASALLRSPDAARLLVEAGVRIENPTTGERMSLDPSTGRVMCGFERVPAAAIPDGDDPALMEWYYLRVANDDGWRIAHDDALTLIRDREGPMAGLLQDSREAYLADSWLTAKGRIEAIPTRERAEELLRRRDVPNMPTRQYRLRDKCGTEGMHAIGEAPARVTATRVA